MDVSTITAHTQHSSDRLPAPVTRLRGGGTVAVPNLGEEVCKVATHSPVRSRVQGAPRAMTSITQPAVIGVITPELGKKHGDFDDDAILRILCWLRQDARVRTLLTGVGQNRDDQQDCPYTTLKRLVFYFCDDVVRRRHGRLHR